MLPICLSSRRPKRGGGGGCAGPRAAQRAGATPGAVHLLQSLVRSSSLQRWPGAACGMCRWAVQLQIWPCMWCTVRQQLLAAAVPAGTLTMLPPACGRPASSRSRQEPAPCCSQCMPHVPPDPPTLPAPRAPIRKRLLCDVDSSHSSCRRSSWTTLTCISFTGPLPATLGRR